MSSSALDLRNVSQSSLILYLHWWFWECLCITINCTNLQKVRESLCFQMFRVTVHLCHWMILQGPPKGHVRCKKYSLQECNKDYCLQMTAYKVTNFILNEYFTVEWTMISKLWTGIVMTLQCVLWTSVSHYALNVKNVMTAFYTSHSCDFFVEYRRTSRLITM